MSRSVPAFASTLIRDVRILDAAEGTLTPADVLIEGDSIAAIARSIDRPCEKVIDGRSNLLLPGLVDAHVHAQNQLSRSSLDAGTLEVLLDHGAALNANRSPEDHYLSAALAAAELIRSGVTAVCELFIEYDGPSVDAIEAVIQAYGDSGLRVIVAPAVIDLSLRDLLNGSFVRDSSRMPASKQLAAVEAVIRNTGTVDARIALGIAPTIPLLCSDELLDGVAELVDAHGVPVQLHLAETLFQATVARRRWGASISSRLDRLNLLGPDTVAAHCIWVDEHDADLLAGSGTTVVTNPASNLKLGSGVADVRRLLDHGVRVAIGTDGCASSDNLNMFEAMRLAALVSRIGGRPSCEWLTAREALTIATDAAGPLFGYRDRRTSIQVDDLADLVLVDTDSPELTPLNDPVHQLVHSESGRAVRTVIVGGRVLLDDGRMTTFDEGRLREGGRDAAGRMAAANADLRRAAANRATRLEAEIRAVTEGEPLDALLALGVRGKPLRVRPGRR